MKNILSIFTLTKNIQLAIEQLKGKNRPRFEIQKLNYKLFEVDLSAIAGVSTNTLFTCVIGLKKGRGAAITATARKLATI